MKKFTFIIATLFVATFANAQIELEATLDGYYQFSATMAGVNGYDFVPASHLYNSDLGDQDKVDGKWVVKLYDLETFNLYKTVFIPAGEETSLSVFNVSQNIFTTDGKVCFCVRGAGNDQHVYLYNEDGQLLYTFEGTTNSGYWKIKDKYLMQTFTYDSNQLTTYIYSLPGNGVATEISSPAPQKSSARKIARDGQVLVETENNTYDLKGQEVK